MKNLIHTAVFMCIFGATFMLAGCDDATSGHEEGMKALRENTANPILQADGLQPKPTKKATTE
ncbi:hypothetical protein [Nitrosomonas sp. HPC101]|uniref:hypothetical protein n=1 Tax=Nitrosomonas sp. HPC101 TaxID=1658667 RepID=UPI00136BB831|nr:hypothetical protein [Nitrosomonas sp. HPC101]